MAKEAPETPDRQKDVFEAGAENDLREAARRYWLNYNLSKLGKNLDIEIETAREAYEKLIGRLEEAKTLSHDRVTEIIKEEQKEAEQDAKMLVKEEISGLN